MKPENHTLFDCNTLDEYSDLKRLEMVFTSLPAGGLLDTLFTCAVAAGETTVRWHPCSRSVLHGSSSSIRQWSGFAANCSAIIC